MKMKMSALVLVAALSGVPIQAAQQAQDWVLPGAFVVAALFGGSSSRTSHVQAEARSEGERDVLPAEPLTPTRKEVEKQEACIRAADKTEAEEIQAAKEKRNKRVAQCNARIKTVNQAKIDAERAKATRLAQEERSAHLQLIAATLSQSSTSQETIYAVLDVLGKRPQRQRDEVKEAPSVTRPAGRGHGVTTGALASATLRPTPARSVTPTPATFTAEVSVEGDGLHVEDAVKALDGKKA